MQWPDNGNDGRVMRSKLNFVDLAGSERWNTKLDMAVSAFWYSLPDLSQITAEMCLAL
jgi:hypothetical protein